MMSGKYTFHTRSKSFSFSLNEYGSYVSIHETHKGRLFTMSLEVEGCKWLTSQLTQIMETHQVENVLRTFRNDKYRLTLTSEVNKDGEFLRLMKVENGSVKSLRIPKEKDGYGWSNFYVFIKKFFNLDNQQGDNLGRIKVVSVGRKDGKGGGPTVANHQRNEDNLGLKEIKDWKMAVTIYRTNTKMSWGEISRNLEGITKRKSEVFQLAADRAVFWCWKEKELHGLLLKPDQLSSYITSVKMVRWSKDDHWFNLQIGVRYSWIGIEGLPLQMWNNHVFKVIGEACGGLLEIAEDTKNKSFLGYAKIKVKGHVSGLMNPVIETWCQGEKVCLGAFSLKGAYGGQYGYRSAGLTTRAVLRAKLSTTTNFGESVPHIVRTRTEQNNGRKSLGNLRWTQKSEYYSSSSAQVGKDNSGIKGCSKPAYVASYRIDSRPEFPEKDSKKTGFLAVPVRSGRGMVADKTREHCTHGKRRCEDQLLRRPISHQLQRISLQDSREETASKKSFKEIVCLGIDKDKDGMLNPQLTGLGLEQEGRYFSSSLSVANKAQRSKLDSGLTKNEAIQISLSGIDVGPSKNEFSILKAHSQKPIDAGFLGRGQQIGEKDGLDRIESNGQIKIRTVGSNKSLTLNKLHEEDVCFQDLIEDHFTAKEFFSEGNNSSIRQTVYEDGALYSDPGVDSAPSKRISRIKSRRKPKKMEDFRVGQIRKWNEYYTRGKNTGSVHDTGDAGDGSTKDKKVGWQVYTRKKKK